MTTLGTLTETADSGNKMNISVNLCSVSARLTVVPLIDFLTKPEPHFLAVLECFFFFWLFSPSSWNDRRQPFTSLSTLPTLPLPLNAFSASPDMHGFEISIANTFIVAVKHCRSLHCMSVIAEVDKIDTSSPDCSKHRNRYSPGNGFIRMCFQTFRVAGYMDTGR